jgi:lysophospholipase L1-like esterase
MVGGILRLAVAVVLVLAVVAGTSELALRAFGARPRPPVPLSQIVPDGWTGFRLRPDVGGPEAFATNDLGMRALRTYTLTPPPVSLRIAVLGSSVVYGMNMPLADSIPGVVERELQAAGRNAEVLNFGTHQFTIVNVSAQLQAYVHQFRPDVVVVVVDLQVGHVGWPDVRPQVVAEAKIEKPSWWETLLRRGARKSALIALLNDPREARRWARSATGLPLQNRSRPASRPSRKARTRGAGPAGLPADRPTAGPPEERRAYEERRERELAAPMAAMAAFCAEKSVALYFVTPYGPYFDVTEDELEQMSVHHLLEEATRVHGGVRDALGAEVELITRVARRVAANGPARVIDMLEASRHSSFRTSPDFTRDGVHLTPAGNAALGRVIAERILQDVEGRRVRRD